MDTIITIAKIAGIVVGVSVVIVIGAVIIDLIVEVINEEKRND